MLPKQRRCRIVSVHASTRTAREDWADRATVETRAYRCQRMHRRRICTWRRPTSNLTARRAVLRRRAVSRASVLVAGGAADDEWPVAQVVSELATNAVVHAGTPFVLSIAHDASHIRVAVTDGRPLARASMRRLSNETTTGRGLRLVQTLGQAWGVDQTDVAKTVWCELRPRLPSRASRRAARARSWALRTKRRIASTSPVPASNAMTASVRSGGTSLVRNT